MSCQELKEVYYTTQQTKLTCPSFGISTCETLAIKQSLIQKEV
jgi:hypothetical protein